MVVPCLDIRGGKVVKGVNFLDVREMGDPVAMAIGYAAQGADAIYMLDIDSAGPGGGMAALVGAVSDAVDAPVIAGGGIRSADDAGKLLAAGAAGVTIGSAAVRDPGLIAEAAAEYGGERIVAAVDAKRTGDSWTVFVGGGRESSGLDAVGWAVSLEEAGAGGILLTSMDRDGVRTGYDIPLTRAVADAVGIPVTASGGCGTKEHIYEVLSQTDAAAALAASLFHTGGCTVREAKEHLRSRGVEVRI